MKKLIAFAKAFAHAAALIFGAFWLVATTNQWPPMPPRDCFTGVESPASLRVELGAPETSADGGTGADPPSCDGIDGLAAGAAVTLTVTQAPRPADGGGCYAFSTESADGLTDVTISSAAEQRGSSESFTAIDGTFTPSQTRVCGGPWFFVLAPEDAPAEGELISPLEAGGTQRWFVYRYIRIAAVGACEPIGQSRPVDGILCEDRFPVAGITRVGP